MTVVSIEPLLYLDKHWQSTILPAYPVKYYGYMLHAAEAAEQPAEVIDYYLGLEGFTCCKMQVGLEIRVDGRSWTDHAADHFWHMGFWLVFAQGLIRKEQQTLQVSFGDQAFDAYVEREGDVLRLMPPSGSRKTAMMVAPFEPFMAQFKEASQDFLQLVKRLNQEVLSRGYDEAELRACLEGKGDLPRSAVGDTKLRLAVMWRELGPPFPEIE